MMGLERSPVGCGVATAFLWLWRAASSFGTGNPYGVVGVRLLFVGAKVSSGGGFTSEVRRGLTPVVILRVTVTASSVFEGGKRRPDFRHGRGGVPLVLSSHPSTGEDHLILHR
ncbi:unnamed protein product [Brassica rapa]|nr:unnamed protein product [Brassica rapa]